MRLRSLQVIENGRTKTASRSNSTFGEAGERAGLTCRLRQAVSSLDDRAATAVQCSATRQFPVNSSRSKQQLTERQRQLQSAKQRAAHCREARHNSKSGKQSADRNAASGQQLPRHHRTAQRSSLGREPVGSKITNRTVGADAVSHCETCSLQRLSPGLHSPSRGGEDESDFSRESARSLRFACDSVNRKSGGFSMKTHV